MKLRIAVTSLLVFSSAVPSVTAGENASQETLTIEQAEAIALANQPRLIAAQLREQEANIHVLAVRSDLLPAIGFNATGVRVADTGTAIGAGNISTSSISDRFAYGGSLSQLVTDFGITAARIDSARAFARAQKDNAVLTRAQIRLEVRQAYYEVLGAEAVLQAARSALDNRRLVAKQLSALAASQLRSTLDVHFAQVLESEAELAVVHAESIVEERRAALATAMGSDKPVTAALGDSTTQPETASSSVDEQLKSALTLRADLNAAQARQDAADAEARSEKRLGLPTLSVQATAGKIPFHDYTLHDDYAAAGFNLNIPLFTGGLYAARRNEAESEARAAELDVKQARLMVNEQVRTAWSRTQEAQNALGVSERLVAESKEALRLAQDRYDAGLGSIVELNEAQLNETSAEIQESDARFEWEERKAELDFAAGLLN